MGGQSRGGGTGGRGRRWPRPGGLRGAELPGGRRPVGPEIWEPQEPPPRWASPRRRGCREAGRRGASPTRGHRPPPGGTLPPPRCHGRPRRRGRLRHGGCCVVAAVAVVAVVAVASGGRGGCHVPSARSPWLSRPRVARRRRRHRGVGQRRGRSASASAVGVGCWGGGAPPHGDVTPSRGSVTPPCHPRRGVSVLPPCCRQRGACVASRPGVAACPRRPCRGVPREPHRCRSSTP